MSFDHIWVQYPGKQANTLENPDVALAQRVNGHYVWHWPKDFHLGAEINAQLGMYWTPMPGLRKALMFIGLMMVLLVNPAASALRRRAGYMDLSRLPSVKTGTLWTSPPTGEIPPWALRGRTASPDGRLYGKPRKHSGARGWTCTARHS